jgi:hypothetical protein
MPVVLVYVIWFVAGVAVQPLDELLTSVDEAAVIVALAAVKPLPMALDELGLDEKSALMHLMVPLVTFDTVTA